MDIGLATRSLRVWLLASAPLGNNVRQVVHTHVPFSPISINWYQCKSQGVNKQTTWCSSPISMVSQHELVSGWGLQKPRSAPPYEPVHLGKDFRLPYVYVNATYDDWSLLNQRADILWARSDRHCHYQMLSSHLKTATDQHLEQVAIVVLLSNNNTHVTSEAVIVTRLWWTPSNSLACLRK